VLAPTRPAAYPTACSDRDQLLADTNGGGVVDVFHIDPFVLLLTGK
jgi:hypothetical protein